MGFAAWLTLSVTGLILVLLIRDWATPDLGYQTYMVYGPGG